VHNEIHTIL